MKQIIRFWLSCGIALSGLATTNPSLAQIVPDGTLPNNSKVTPQGNTSTITGGTRAGGNLFHSFAQFSVPTNGVAHFNNALDIQNIISRVTGTSISNIDGLIRANGIANLFLINPNGIIFGRNASLNIGGSFVGSTASSLKFADGNQFSATAPQTVPLLTVSVPIGLQFGGNPGSIRNLSQATNSSRATVGLEVLPGKSLALVGGDVSLEGGGRLNAAGGRVELGGNAGVGTVGLGIDGNTLNLSFTPDSLRSNVTLSNDARVSVLGSGGGNIAVNANAFTATNGGRLVAGTQGQGNGGDITVNANNFSISGVGFSGNGAGLYNQTFATGNAGNIFVNITAGSLSVTNGAQVNATTFGQGNAGNVTIKADDAVSFDGVAVINSKPLLSGVLSEVRGTGNAGDINITAGSLSVTNGAQVSAITAGQGNAGNVTIKADGAVSFDGEAVINRIPFPSKASSALATQSVDFASGFGIAIPIQGIVGNRKGGDIRITAGSLSVTNGAALLSATSGKGNAGSIFVQANGPVSVAGAHTVINTSSVSSTTVSNGGDIGIQSHSLSVTGGAQVAAGTGGQGNSGNILVTAKDEVEVSGVAPYPVLKDGSPGGAVSGLFTSTERGASGQGGELSVTTNTLRISDGANLRASSGSAFRGGNIIVKANVLEATGGGQIVTNAFNSGDAGNITVQVKDRIAISGSDSTFNERFKQVAEAFPNGWDNYGLGNLGLDNLTTGEEVAKSTVGQGETASGLSARTYPGSTGSGGSIFIDTNRLTLTDGAGIAVNSFGKGNAGNLNIQAGTVTLDGGSSLSTTTASTEGGNINLQAQDLLLMRHGSQISATAGTERAGGNGGNITINTPFIVAVPSENSDISANAFTGNGGRVNINIKGGGSVFGTQFRSQQTPQSDITANSTGGGINGVVNINTLDVNPSLGLVNLPIVPVDITGLIAQGCPAGVGSRASKFVVTGRGGLPPNPSETLSSDTVWSDLRPHTRHTGSSEGAKDTTLPTNSTPGQLVEATGWVTNPKGEVVLTAAAPTVTPDIPWLKSTTCDAP